PRGAAADMRRTRPRHAAGRGDPRGSGPACRCPRAWSYGRSSCVQASRAAGPALFPAVTGGLAGRALRDDESMDAELFPRSRTEVVTGAVHVPDWLDEGRQLRLLEACRE